MGVRFMLNKILVPVDGSETAWRALAEAKDLAVKFGASLVVVNVVQMYSSMSIPVVPLDQETFRDGNKALREIGEKILADAKEKLTGFIGPVEYVQDVGHPSRRILAVCEDQQCDAIVIGCRGLSGIEEFFLGSVSSKVLEYSKVPVLVVK